MERYAFRPTKPVSPPRSPKKSATRRRKSPSPPEKSPKTPSPLRSPKDPLESSHMEQIFTYEMFRRMTFKDLLNLSSVSKKYRALINDYACTKLNQIDYVYKYSRENCLKHLKVLFNNFLLQQNIFQKYSHLPPLIPSYPSSLKSKKLIAIDIDTLEQLNSFVPLYTIQDYTELNSLIGWMFPLEYDNTPKHLRKTLTIEDIKRSPFMKLYIRPKNKLIKFIKKAVDIEILKEAHESYLTHVLNLIKTIDSPHTSQLNVVYVITQIENHNAYIDNKYNAEISKMIS